MAFSFGDDDGGFGEFNYIVSLSQSPQQHIPHHRQQQQDRDDDDWGDFVQSPQNNSIPPPSSSSPDNNGKWEKPTGAIPLSIFGVEEEEEEEPPEPTQFLFNNNSNNGFSSPSPPKPFARDVMDLISDLYAQPPPPANASTGSDLQKEKDHCENGDVDEDDDNSWEFKDAFSPIKGGGDGDGNGNGIQAAGIGLETVLEASDQLRVHNGGSEPCGNLYSAQDRGANGLNFDSDIAYRHFISDTSRHTHCTSNGNGMHPSLENGLESIDDKMWDFKDAFTGDAVESGSLGKQKTPPDHEPHMFMRGSKVQAEKELRASIELFGHASSVTHILRLASKEEQQAYISAWSMMARACTKELQHGAMIWKESLDTNIPKEILSLGSGYFAALAEIYRVTEILRISLKLYKPWILSNPEDCSREVVSCLKICAELWATSGLEKTLENSISADTIDCKVKMPARSIRLLHDLDELSFQNHAFDHNNVACKLSLLPVDKLQGTKVITWNGDHYCLKLANFWANRVSCDPPQLPRIPTNLFKNSADRF